MASEEICVVVGLGNPGRQYEQTRHNLGFLAIDELFSRWEKVIEIAAPSLVANHWNRSGWSTDGDLERGIIEGGGRKYHFLKPQSYMNRSGEPLQSFFHFYKLTVGQMVVLHDELDLPLGVVRVKFGGGEAGNNGLRSISSCMGTRDYYRVRLGIGRPSHEREGARGEGVVSYVLNRFTAEERRSVDPQLETAGRAVVHLMAHGLKSAQNKFNV